ncbi:PTS sugar transporter subunit IIA [Clostridium tertium]|jgi:N-acetylgalactosamine PTS system EIIA component|uniref:PTS sugar transporter subunit IIA n=1 Tax=Clostridium TaxID=1485 RepID=UPI001157F48D|nr:MULTISPECIES: PTS sugar transporter subunit IIA [Clostridium]MBS5306904.1 PTS sugar transporter subunit IIA [Clostridium sp.]MDB1921058.1 PTS sugar transporter subunit IIA [Clostridium tertium]MDB1925244.1 PTS sugar transporter subunit IIA [Clostridium tertium]MDB1930330.1 PTS sugar transporter subunit IIA [Clostridium tertium]MDB1933913.1 PTS sugar transporter subunit IIA [Clostridium tertium]
MIGLIISGHGNFASGLRSSLKLIAGEPCNVEYVDFEETDSIEDLRKKYYISLKNLDNCDSILALSDLVGGSPFKTLVEVKTSIEKPMEVIGGTNLPMILEISMTKDIADDLHSLSESAIEVGKSGVVKFEFIVHEDDESEDGI